MNPLNALPTSFKSSPNRSFSRCNFRRVARHVGEGCLDERQNQHSGFRSRCDGKAALLETLTQCYMNLGEYETAVETSEEMTGVPA